MRIGIVGCAGRMGQMLVREVLKTDAATLAGGTEPEGSPQIGRDLGALVGTEDVGVGVTDDPKALFQAADAIIDFTRPEPTMTHARLAAETGTALIIGTTGLSTEQETEIATLAAKTPIVLAPNMSVGVNLLFALTQKVAATLGIDYDIEIVEMHHRHKVDAPSGTALGLGRAAGGWAWRSVG